LCININCNEQNKTISIIDALGKTLSSYELKTGTNELKIGKELKSGIYFLQQKGHAPIKVIKY
jgi:hypothetical protein